MINCKKMYVMLVPFGDSTPILFMNMIRSPTHIQSCAVVSPFQCLVPESDN